MEAPDALTPVPPPLTAPKPDSRASSSIVFHIGLIAILLAVLAILIVPALRASWRDRRPAGPRNSLKNLGSYMALYESRFKSYPRDMKDLERFEPGVKACSVCPRCGKRFTFLVEVSPSGTWTPAGGAAYSWTPSTVFGNGPPPDLPVAWHRCPLLGDDTDVLLFRGLVDVFGIGSPVERAIETLQHPAPPLK